MAAALSPAAAGAGNLHYPLAADTARRDHPLAQRLGEMGAFRAEGSVQHALRTARLKSRHSGPPRNRVYLYNLDNR